MTLPVSKNQAKKQARWEKKVAGRKEKRQQEKARRKERKANGNGEGEREKRPRQMIKLMADSTCQVRVAVDMAFEEYMPEAGTRSTVAQLAHCYSANRRANNPLQYHIVGLGGKAKEIFDSIPGYRNWDVHISEEALGERWPKEEIVYLSSESENVLTALDPSKVYVIGGLIDHNSQKGLTHSLSLKNGFEHARLPIDEHISLKTRKVLTINHVFEIILHFSESNNWEEALLSVIPKRKGAEKKEEAEEEE